MSNQQEILDLLQKFDEALPKLPKPTVDQRPKQLQPVAMSYSFVNELAK